MKCAYRTSSWLLTVALLMGAFGSAGAQTETEAGAWAGGGLIFAGSSRNIESALGALLQLGYQTGAQQFSVRGLWMSDFAGFPDSGGGDRVAEAAVLYGRVASTRAPRASISAGLSFLQFYPCPAEERECTTVGVPVVAEATLHARVVGIGAQLFANLNPKASYVGLALVLSLGWIP